MTSTSRATSYIHITKHCEPCTSTIETSQRYIEPQALTYRTNLQPTTNLHSPYSNKRPCPHRHLRSRRAATRTTLPRRPQSQAAQHSTSKPAPPSGKRPKRPATIAPPVCHDSLANIRLSHGNGIIMHPSPFAMHGWAHLNRSISSQLGIQNTPSVLQTRARQHFASNIAKTKFSHTKKII